MTGTKADRHVPWTAAQQAQMATAAHPPYNATAHGAGKNGPTIVVQAPKANAILLVSVRLNLTVQPGPGDHHDQSVLNGSLVIGGG